MSTPPTAPDSEDRLQWKPRKMVVWLDPLQLAGTGLRSLISAVFGAYADKREVQAALTPTRGSDPQPYSLFHDKEEIWIDYTADLGDGFDSTYTVARLLAEPELSPRGWDGPPLQRGQILMLGGDQVYPTARRDEYRARFEFPYRFALPWVPDERAPSLFAVPGNHDWYDGLTSFTRLFCQNRWIGGWKTRQARSYFAVRLPHNWWLWGIDIQLEADIDLPQLEYFRRIAETPDFKGARVILCTGTPSWTEMIKANTPEKRAAYRNLGHFENKVIIRNGGTVEVTLTGDMHHYCRYACTDPAADAPSQKITSGGGGAYLYGTHGMPEALEIDNPQDGEPPVPYALQTVYPPKAESRKLANVGILFFPFRNWRFAVMLGSFYALNAWIVQGASGDETLSLFGSLSALALTPANVGLAIEEVLHVLVHSPVSFALSTAFTFALYAFADANTKLGRAAMGISHAAVHLSLNFALCWLISRSGYLLYGLIAFEPTATGTTDPFNASLQVIGVLLVVLALSTFAGGWLFGIYLYLSERIAHRHMEKVFSSQHIADFKNFLRLHIDRSGALAIHPIGIDSVCTRWTYQPGATDGRAFFDPTEGNITERAHLIEPPIRFPARDIPFVS